MPSLPLPSTLMAHLQYSFSAYTLAILILITLLSISPTIVFYILSNFVLVLALLGTYLLPALIHITMHNVKRPLSIIMSSSFGTPSHSRSHSRSGSPGSPDELLQRKELALQKKQWKKRLLWDIGVWIFLVPVSGGGIVWVVGKVVMAW
jgi:hypothetical protein